MLSATSVCRQWRMYVPKRHLEKIIGCMVKLGYVRTNQKVIPLESDLFQCHSQSSDWLRLRTFIPRSDFGRASRRYFSRFLECYALSSLDSTLSMLRSEISVYCCRDDMVPNLWQKRPWWIGLVTDTRDDFSFLWYRSLSSRQGYQSILREDASYLPPADIRLHRFPETVDASNQVGEMRTPWTLNETSTTSAAIPRRLRGDCQ